MPIDILPIVILQNVILSIGMPNIILLNVIPQLSFYWCHRNLLKLMGRHTFIFDIDYRGYHLMILVYFTVGSTSSGSAFVIAPKLGAKIIFESISLWRRLLPPYFLIRFPDWISLTFVQFKDVTLTWINYLETWLRSDNTSCYYKGTTEKVLKIMMQLELI